MTQDNKGLSTEHNEAAEGEQKPLRQGDVYGAEAYTRGVERATEEHNNLVKQPWFKAQSPS